MTLVITFFASVQLLFYDFRASDLSKILGYTYKFD